MKLLTRDTSAYRFMALGGLLSKKKLNCSNDRTVPAILEEGYISQIHSFGIDEENVRRFLMSFMKKELGWEDVQKKHDILCTSGEDKLVIECKRYKSTLTFLDEHEGGSKSETCVEELQRNLKRFEAKWGILTDGVDFRLYYSDVEDPNFSDVYIEVSLKDIVDSSHRWPEELYILLDILSPNSQIRKNDPKNIDGVPEAFVKKAVKILKDNDGSLKTVMKSLAVACLEDMGVRPLHHDLLSIRSAKTTEEYTKIFKSILDDDGDFHQSNDRISQNLVAEIHDLFLKFTDIDFAHVDYEFFGVIYQKFINNGNASHYTNSKLSKEMATYIACRNEKSQKKGRPIYLEDGDYILDPAVGSGQLLRNLLPFYKVFFSGTVKGIDGWRKLAIHMMGRDIDPEAVWLSKINLWLATAKKGEAFVSLDEFKHIDVIEASINRRAGESINDALAIETGNSVVAVVSNPPWDAFKNDSRRGVTFDPQVVAKIKQSLGLTSRQLNRAQIFTKIILMIGEENAGMRFSIVLPDSIFVDQNDDLRESLEGNLDFYFSYPRNIDPISKTKIFPDVDATRKFGIMFGRSSGGFESISCYPMGGEQRIVLNEVLKSIGDFSVFPMFSHPLQGRLVEKWKEKKTRDVKWYVGEFDQSLWAKNTDRLESAHGTRHVLGGSSFCDPNAPWSTRPSRTTSWKKFSQVSEADMEVSSVSRTIFSDYINNSKKLNSASYLDSRLRCNIINTLLYSQETEASDWLIYDSAIFGSFVEAYGTSQHMNAWRLTALGLPDALTETDSLKANIELCAKLELHPKDCMDLYDLNENWLATGISKKDWVAEFNNLYLQYSTKKVAQSNKIPFAELIKRRQALTGLIIKEMQGDELRAVKLAKLIYLSEMEMEIDLGGQYVKDAAGPVDSRLLYNGRVGLFPNGTSSDIGLVKNGSYKGEDGKTYKITTISPSAKTDTIAGLISGLIPEKIEGLKSFLKMFKKLDWRQCEAIATVYACWNDLLLSGKEPTNDAIIKDFFRWSEEKKDRFEVAEVVGTIKWMKRNKVIPKGRGRKTALKQSRLDVPF